jgi:hypothetical protein
MGTLDSTIAEVTAAGEFRERRKPGESSGEPAAVHIGMAGNLTLPRGTSSFEKWIF